MIDIFERADQLGLLLIPSVYCYGVRACENGEVIYFNPQLPHSTVNQEVHKIMDQFEEYVRGF